MSGPNLPAELHPTLTRAFPITVIESPLSGDVARNCRYARAAMLDSLNRGEAPFLSHLLYPQVWDDTHPTLRELGMAAGMRYHFAADRVAFYIDLGWSEGMELARLHLLEVNRIGGPKIAVERRSIEWHWENLEPKIPSGAFR